MFGAVVTVVALNVAAADVVVVLAVVHQSAVVVVAAAVVRCVVAAAGLAEAVNAVERFVIGVLVVHDVAVAVVVAGPQALPTAFARGHCFVVDSLLTSPVKQQVFSCPV